MAVISPSTFDALRSYVNVRLQQGVPIVDADWNELDDMRKFELRAFLKWFVGDGIPGAPGGANNDAFHISVAAPTANDFTILSGVTGAVDPLHNLGWGLVDGLSVFITADTKFSAQPLNSSQAGSAALSTKLGVPVIPALTTPVANGTLTVYLDVWERLVTPTEDPSLVAPGLGTESCARMKREWVVRTRAAAGAPVLGNPDFIAGHSYYALATLARRNADPNINPADIADLRQTHLTLTDANRRLSNLERLLLLPAFNASPGQFSPKIGPLNQPVTLNGRNFTVGTPHVLFGATAATIQGTPTSTQIIALVPASGLGSVKITVTTDGGTVVSDDSFVGS